MPHGGLRGRRQETLGCFQHDRSGTGTVIRIFPERARRLVQLELAHLCPRRGNLWHDYLAAILLGRALAHELGHYILGPEHSTTGLMRAELEPRDVVTSAPEAVSLTAAQIGQLSSRRLGSSSDAPRAHAARATGAAARAP